MGIHKDNWKKFFFNSKEGLGTDYDRILCERVLEKFISEYKIKSVLDCPSFGMTGFSGINSIYLAKKGIDVTICEDNPERLEWVKNLWEEIGLNATFILVKYNTRLPFDDQSFDFVWNLSALWHINNGVHTLIKELGRVTGKCLFTSVYNLNQLFYPIWKSFEPEFFLSVNEEYSKEITLEKIFNENLNGFGIKEKGYIVTTPWPGVIIKKEQITNKILRKKTIEEDTIYHNYKLDDIRNNISLPTYVDILINHKRNKTLENLMILEKLPNFIKRYWSHLIYWTYSRV